MFHRDVSLIYTFNDQHFSILVKEECPEKKLTNNNIFANQYFSKNQKVGACRKGLSPSKFAEDTRVKQDLELFSLPRIFTPTRKHIKIKKVKRIIGICFNRP
uniref:Uncharacterized protein n=1 Tax=Nelumbo nucifera TaxID=4432 RepID=A0A822XMQ9_NELNU|nr:TPA_asm: hypothetical protein HUJ06_022446 [Nelumbo nucifera]